MNSMISAAVWMLSLSGTVSAVASVPEISAKENDEDDFSCWEPVYSNSSDIFGADTSATLTTFNDSPAPEPLSPALEEEPLSPILGDALITDAEALCRFVRRHNAEFPIEVAEAFISVGKRYGIRGDIALCQAIIETGWFKFDDGTAVKPEQHNYCGLGVTGRGKAGSSFESVEQGVTAQIQHLYAYACKHPLPDGETLHDPRFSLVSRGTAPNWNDLSNRWAMNPNYGRQILQLYNQLLQSLNALAP